MFYFVLSCRALPQVIQAGSASCKLVQEFPSCRKSDEILQLYTCVKSQTSSHLHASNVVSQGYILRVGWYTPSWLMAKLFLPPLAQNSMTTRSPSPPDWISWDHPFPRWWYICKWKKYNVKSRKILVTIILFSQFFTLIFLTLIALSIDIIKCRDALYGCNHCSFPFFAWQASMGFSC